MSSGRGLLALSWPCVMGAPVGQFGRQGEDRGLGRALRGVHPWGMRSASTAAGPVPPDGHGASGGQWP